LGHPNRPFFMSGVVASLPAGAGPRMAPHVVMRRGLAASMMWGS
jgi:hypothetical protein